MNSLNMIDRYAILGKIGQGGMSTVYRAFDPDTQTDVAIKLLRETLRDDDELRGRFAQEAKLLSELRHPAIIPLIGYGEVNGRLYFVMPYMESGSLKDWLEEGIPPFAKTVAILNQIAAGLDAAHQHDIIHRDLKPHNIMLDDDGTAYLSDFGVARLLDHDKPEQTMTLIGTPEYMAPEQVLEGKLSRQTDIYQLGVVLFQMLTGERPFEGATHAVMSQHLNAPIPSVEARNPKLPQGCDAVIQQAMAKKPTDRFMSATALAEALQACSQNQPARPRLTLPPLPNLVTVSSASTENGRSTPPPKPRPKRKAGKMAGIMGLGVMMVGLGLFAVGGLPVGAPNGGGNNPPPPRPAQTIDQPADNGGNDQPQNGRGRGANNNRNNGRNNDDNAGIIEAETAVAELGVPPVVEESVSLAETAVIEPVVANIAAVELPQTATFSLQADTAAPEPNPAINSQTSVAPNTDLSADEPTERPANRPQNRPPRPDQRDGGENRPPRNGRSPQNRPPAP